MKRAFCIVMILALAPPAMAQTVLDSDFTIVVTLPSGEGFTESTTLVPLLEGTCYNWRLRLGKTKGALVVTEVYTLPAAPKSWEIGSDSGIVVADDKRSATTTLSLLPLNGWIENGWCVSVGDPEGPYSFDILSGDTLLHRFEFEVKPL